MNKTVIVLLFTIFIARSEHNWYLDAGAKGIGIGNEIKYKSLLFHFGCHTFITYEHNDRYADSIIVTDNKTCLQLIPYLGFGINISLRNNFTLKTFIDYLQIHHWGYESISSSKSEDITSGFFYDQQYDLFRIVLGGTYYKWKIPLGLLIDADFIHKWNGGFNIQVSPRLIIYL